MAVLYSLKVDRASTLKDSNLPITEIKSELEDTDIQTDSFENTHVKQEEDSSHVCSICNGSYPSDLSLKKHIRNTHSAKVKCEVCNREMTKKSLPRHLKEIHNLNHPPKEEEEGNFEEDSGEMINLEEKTEIEQDTVGPYEALCKVEMNESTTEGEKNMDLSFKGAECKICNQTYSSLLNLKKHVYNVHRMTRVKCDVCDKEVNKKSLDRHMKSVHSAKVSLKRTRKLVPEEEKIPCSHCDKKCSSAISLQSHVKSIHEAEQFKCPKCDFKGIRRLLEKHMKKEHNDEVYQCNRCQKVLKSKSTLREHMWIHTDHRRFICDICGMRFKRTSNYHGHLKSHQEKKFQCQLCGNFFLRKRYLAIHEQTIHNYYGEGVPPQEKGYQCEVCGIKLKWKNNLLGHMRIHTGEKPYKCKICGDDFTCHGSLRTHMSKHAICSTPIEVSSVFIQQAYLENRTESVEPNTSSARDEKV